MTFCQYSDKQYAKDYKTDKTQSTWYNIVCPKIIIPPQKLKVGSIPQVKVLIMYKPEVGEYKQWNGLLEWNTGLNYWNSLN